MERELRLTGFWGNIPACNKLSTEIQTIILSSDYAAILGLVQKRAEIISSVIELAEKNNDVILYAP